MKEVWPKSPKVGLFSFLGHKYFGSTYNGCHSGVMLNQVISILSGHL